MIHFALGDAAAGTLRLAFPDEEVVVCRDLFGEGPCRFDSVDDARDWLLQRNKWWRSHGASDVAAAEAHVRSNDALVDAIARADVAVVWAGDECEEQLFACWAIAQLGDHVDVAHARPPPPKRTPYTATGIWRPEQLVAGAVRLPVDASARDAARASWSAWCAPTPTAFAHAAATASVPFANRLRALIERFPARADGLTRAERALLERLRDHPNESTARLIGTVMSWSFETSPDALGDHVLLSLVGNLAVGGLLTFAGNRDEIRSVKFALTPLGRKVLDGRANRVPHAGLDRWIGGTHLDASTGKMWFLVDGSRLIEDQCSH